MTWPAVVDGSLRKDGRVDVLALGSGFQHGDGLFETLPLKQGRLLYFDPHCERLEAGARDLEFEEVPPRSLWAGDVRLLAGSLGMGDLSVRLILFRDGERIRRVAAASEAPKDAGGAAATGLVAPSLNGGRAFANLKTLNYLAPRRAHALGRREGFDEVFFTTERGELLEGTRSSLFAVVGGTLRTAPLSLPVLPGVTRQVLLSLARAAGMAVEERAVTLDEFAGASEAFLTASLRGVRPVKSWCGRPMPPPGPVTRALSAAYERDSRQKESYCDLGLP